MFENENWDINEVLDDIVLGRGVKRTIHYLEYGEHIYTRLFIERLQFYRFRPILLKNITIRVGWRAPAFFISGKQAIFGYVFWEVFSEDKKRKIFGSTVKNEKGDWKYVLSENSQTIVFVNLNRQEEVDIYHLL